MQALCRLIKWLAKHIVIKSRNLNDDKDAKPVTRIEIGVHGDF